MLTVPTADLPEVHFGWIVAYPMTSAHYVPSTAEVRWRNDRPYGDAPCTYRAALDEAGDATVALVPRCVPCARWVAGECLACDRGLVYHRDEVGGGTVHQHESVCQACAGTGRHGQVVA